MQANKDAVLVAVAQNGLALQYTHWALRGNRDIVLRAIEQTGDALCFASEQLRADKAIVIAALQSGTTNGTVWDCVPGALQDDGDATR